MYHLIIPSNLNLMSFENIIIAYQDHYSEFNSILILNTNESLKQDINLRNEIIRNVFGIEIEIREKIISNETNLKITEVINNSLRQYNNDHIVIDLTNGTKELSSLLYMASSLSKIHNINYVIVQKNESGKFYELKKIKTEILKNYYQIKYFEPLQDLNSLGRWNFFDLLFYKEKISNIFQTYPSNMEHIIEVWEIQFNKGLELYFDGEEKYDEALRTFGVLLEDITKNLYHILKTKSEYINKPVSFVFDDYFKKIRQKHKQKEIFNDYRDINFATDYFMNIIREYRNNSSHSIKIKFKEEDLQTVIILLINLFIKLKDFFRN